MVRGEQLLVQEKTTPDKFNLLHYFIESGGQKEAGVTIERACEMFGVSRSGYYSWQTREETEEQEFSDFEKRLLEKIPLIIQALSHVPGAKRMAAHLRGAFNLKASRKLVSKLMKKVGLVADAYYYKRVPKDPYKGQAKHDHPAKAVKNQLNQVFDGEQPRTIIVTDITYIHYNCHSRLAYLVIFRDAVTKEILGWNLSEKMDVALIRGAWDMMMENHKNEFKKGYQILVHSDQGCQYTSVEYKDLFKDGLFTQSMSRRGNSQDNAPAESFFAVLKQETMAIDRCTKFHQVKSILEGYINTYNEDRIQLVLGWMSPKNYYYYRETGQITLSCHYGAAEEELMELKEYHEKCLKQQEEKREQNRKNRQKNAAKIEAEAECDSPLARMEQDLRQARNALKHFEYVIDRYEKRVTELKELIQKIEKAMAFMKSASEEVKESLKKFYNWSRYEELEYVESFSRLIDRNTVFS